MSYFCKECGTVISKMTDKECAACGHPANYGRTDGTTYIDTLPNPPGEPPIDSPDDTATDTTATDTTATDTTATQGETSTPTAPIPNHVGDPAGGTPIPNHVGDPAGADLLSAGNDTTTDPPPKKSGKKK